MNSGIFTLNSYVVKPVLQILTCFNLHSKEIDGNVSADLEVNRRSQMFTAHVLILTLFSARNLCRNMSKMPA